MKDFYDHPISVGDDVVLASEDLGIEGMISLYKHYKVTGLREEEGRVVVTDDRGLEGWYRADRFVRQTHFSELP